MPLVTSAHPYFVQLMERLQNKYGFGLMAVSLGYADTLMSLSAASTSSELSDADKANADISDGYVRMSVGVTGELESARF
jgi:methionine-gamma-lyase